MADKESSSSSEVSPVPFSELLKQHYLLLILGAVILVLLLGFYLMRPAYQVPSAGVVYPLQGQQIGHSELTLYSTFQLDTAALSQSILKNGQPDKVVNIAERQFTNAFQYRINTEAEEGDVISVDVINYNFERETDYSLSQELSWEYSADRPFVDIVQESESSHIASPEFMVTIAGSEAPSEEELIVFSIAHSGYSAESFGVSDTARFTRECSRNRLDHRSLDWSRLQIRDIDIIERAEDQVVFRPSGNWGRTNECFFVTLKNNAYSHKALYSNPYQPASATLSLSELFNPDQDFNSIIQVDFKTPYYDTRQERTEEEEIAYRLEHKKKLAGLISASPALDIAAEDIVLHANKALIPLRLTENTHYEITLAEGTDVYGDAFSEQSLALETGELKYLGIRQKERQAIFMDTAPPTLEVLHYDVDNPTIKLCRIGLEEYAKIEQMVSRRSEYDFSENFFLEGLDNLPVKSCKDQLITLEENSYRTPVDIEKLIGSPARSGLYYVTFAFQSERQASSESPAFAPLFFSIIDAHISMKVSKNGEALFWVNDLKTGKGIPGLTIKGYQNEFKTYEGSYDNARRQWVETHFNPVDSDIFSDAVVLGKTDASGFLEVDLKRSVYQDAFQSWYDAPEYKSLAVTAANDQHLSYVVSKWNSGIAGWNFGFAPTNWDPSGTFRGHVYTDRKLYKPGEVVHIKSIIREEAANLVIPKQKFTLTVQDSNYENVLEKQISLNSFGSHVENLTIADDAALGVYRITISGDNGDETETIHKAEFNVEEFKKPTFKVEVAVDSPDLEKDQFFDPEVDEEQTRWGYRYKSYKKTLNLNTKVRASYYAGGVVPDANYQYVVFKQYYYEPSDWYGCFWGCYWEPRKDYYTEGTGTLDSAGSADITIPINHTTRWNNFRYIVEIAVTDQTSQKVTGTGSVIVKLPESLRQSDPNMKVELETDRQFVESGGELSVVLKPERQWSEAQDGRFRMIFKHRQYTTKHQKQVGNRIVPQVDYEDEILEDIAIDSETFSVTDEGVLKRALTLPKDGEYLIVLQERRYGDNYEYLKHQKVYAYTPGGVTNTPVVADNKIAVLTEKVSYHLGETGRLFVRLPFADGKALITIEKKQVVSKELVDISGNTLIKEFEIDDTFVPNAYISVIAFKPSGDTNIQPEYKVGYAEVVVDKTDKKMFLEAKTDAEIYSPRETVELELVAVDKNDRPISAELSVAVVDEALIAMMGNIDLDILPKFFKKILFQTHTALTNVAMMKHIYFARKGFIGGSGSKDGGDQIFTRSDFKNTAFYAGTVVTGSDGKAKLDFKLPDNIGDFRVISLGHSKDNFFGATEKTISVRQEVVIEETFPLIVRIGDDMRVGATAFNNSDEAKTLFVSLDAEGLTTPDDNRQEVEVAAGERAFVTWRVRVEDKKLDEITYTLSAVDSVSKKGDRIEKTVPVAITPLLAERITFQDDFEASTETTLKLLSDLNREQSEVELRFSTTILAGVDKAMGSLLIYPYGCIEQTISSTLPNAIVKKFKGLLDIGISERTLQKNLNAGIKRFASMQTDDGGFAYWPGSPQSDAYITPYAVLAIVQMQDLGANIPDGMIGKAQDFIEGQVNSLSGEIHSHRLGQLVHELHALSRLESSAFGTARSLIKNRLDELTTHEKIVYALALAKKDVNNYRSELNGLIDTIDLKKAGDSGRNWYWDRTADKALFTQLLIRVQPENPKITEHIKELYALDLGSYYYSTQAKIQGFIAFTEFIEHIDTGKKQTANVSYRIGNKSGQVRLSQRNFFKKVSFPLREALRSGDSLDVSVETDSTGQPLYFDALVSQIPSDPTSISAQQDQGVTVSRQYFKLGKVKEDDSDQWWRRDERDLGPVSGGNFNLGETYLVKVRVNFDDPQRQVALESYLPAGFKLLNPRFLTEQTQVGEDRWNWPYTYQEFRSDRFFASAERVGDYQREREIRYYVRAILPGEFLEPPISVYPMYQPEVEAHTEFRTIVIEE